MSLKVIMDRNEADKCDYKAVICCGLKFSTVTSVLDPSTDLSVCPSGSGLVQEPPGQVSQEAAQPAEGAAPETEGGVRSCRGFYG